MSIEKKAADILVQCGYARKSLYDSRCVSTPDKFEFLVSPFADTLEGRRQLEAIWKWLFENRNRYLMAGLQSEDLLRLVDRTFVCQVVTRCLERIEVLQ